MFFEWIRRIVDFLNIFPFPTKNSFALNSFALNSKLFTSEIQNKESQNILKAHGYKVLNLTLSYCFKIEKHSPFKLKLDNFLLRTNDKPFHFFMNAQLYYELGLQTSQFFNNPKSSLTLIHLESEINKKSAYELESSPQNNIYHVIHSQILDHCIQLAEYDYIVSEN